LGLCWRPPWTGQNSSPAKETNFLTTQSSGRCNGLAPSQRNIIIVVIVVVIVIVIVVVGFLVLVDVLIAISLGVERLSSFAISSRGSDALAALVLGNFGSYFGAAEIFFIIVHFHGRGLNLWDFLTRDFRLFWNKKMLQKSNQKHMG
jgi:hypothetical protein